MNLNYQPPKKFKIGLTPEEFDQYRFLKDDLADAIAESVYDFSLEYAKHHFELTKQYDPSVKKQKEEIIIEEKAYAFFNEFENAISNPHEPGSKTRFRYKWNEEIVKLADSINSNAIKLLDDYFDDTRDEKNDPFAFLYSKEVQETLDRGAQVLLLYGPNVILILAVRSLLKQYAAFNASNVLVSTKFLTRFPHRRIFETMQFLIDVITPGNLVKDGKGIVAIKKLRLVHALVRHRIKINEKSINKKFTGWNPKLWGEPINQMDMIFAIHTFSIEIIRGLQKVGYFLDLSDASRIREKKRGKVADQFTFTSIKEDYYLAWHYIGKALGVRDEINPKSYQDGWELQEYIYQTQFKLGVFNKDNPELAEYPNLTSPVLAEPLINFIIDLLPFTNRRKDALAVVAFYNDEEDYDVIFKDILGLDIRALSSTSFKYFLAGSLNIFDKCLELFYRYVPKYGIKNKFHLKRLESLNRTIYIKLRRMSSSWKGSSFTLRDGLDNKKGIREALMRNQRRITSVFYYIFGYVLLPIFGFLFRPLFRLVSRWIAKHGKKNPRDNFNDTDKLHEHVERYCAENKKEIENGDIRIDPDLMKELDLAFIKLNFNKP